jgi:hypothetical protein
MMADKLALPFLLACDTLDGVLYVQHLDRTGRPCSLVDDPAAALELEAIACQCQQAYFVIEPPLHGSVWEAYHPIAILPLVDHDRRLTSLCAHRTCRILRSLMSLWITARGAFARFTKAISHGAQGSTACTQGLWTSLRLAPRTPGHRLWGQRRNGGKGRHAG